MEETIRIKDLEIMSLIIGIIYITFGVIEMASFLLTLDVMFIARDIMGGFVLVTIGLIFLEGYKKLDAKDPKTLGFPLVGSILAIAFAALFFLILIAEAIEAYVIMNEDYAGWTVIEAIRPELYLALLTIPVILKLYKLILKEKVLRTV